MKYLLLLLAFTLQGEEVNTAVMNTAGVPEKFVVVAKGDSEKKYGLPPEMIQAYGREFAKLGLKGTFEEQFLQFIKIYAAKNLMQSELTAPDEFLPEIKTAKSSIETYRTSTEALAKKIEKATRNTLEDK